MASLLLITSYRPSQANIIASAVSNKLSYSKTSGTAITPNYLYVASPIALLTAN